jgi:HPt (histidine-containing phosphotransfer) domain-containing protein
MPGHREPIDFVHLARQSGGDQSLEEELLGLFFDQCSRQLQQLADSARPLSARADAAHTLKGAALAVGAFDVADAASEAETALLQGLNADLMALEAAGAAARGIIARIMGKSHSSAHSPAHSSPLQFASLVS